MSSSLDNAEGFVVAAGNTHRGEPQLGQGAVVGSIKLEKVLSEGDVHTLYLGSDLRSGAPRVLKEFFPRRWAQRAAAGAIEPREQRFAEELRSLTARYVEMGRVLAHVQHVNLVPVLEVFEANGTGYWVLEYCEGTPLAEVLPANPVDATQLARFLDSLLDVLALLHGKGLVHARVAPSHILVTRDGRYLLTGLGASQVPLSQLAGGTSQADLDYLAPEYWRAQEGSGKRVAATDFYGVAAVAYRLATGLAPYSSRDRLVRDALPELSRSKAGKHYPPELVKAIDCALRLEVAERPQSAGAWRELQRQMSRKAWPWMVALALVALAGLGAYILWPQEKPPEPPAVLVAGKPGEMFTDCPKCPLMAWVPGGKFKRGSVDGPSDEQPSVDVVIEKPFAVARWETSRKSFHEFVTDQNYQSQGKPCVAANPAITWENPGYPQSDSDPVVCVSWHDAKEYVAWLNRIQKEGVYRLLSETEWEYAARGGESSASTPWGDKLERSCAKGNFLDQSFCARPECERNKRCQEACEPKPLCSDHAIFTAPADPTADTNGFKLNHMLGNVREWVEDCYYSTYAAVPTDGRPSLPPAQCSQRSVRGGSFQTLSAVASFSARDYLAQDGRSPSVGFRVARDPGSAKPVAVSAPQTNKNAAK